MMNTMCLIGVESGSDAGAGYAVGRTNGEREAIESDWPAKPLTSGSSFVRLAEFPPPLSVQAAAAKASVRIAATMGRARRRHGAQVWGAVSRPTTNPTRRRQGVVIGRSGC